MLLGGDRSSCAHGGRGRIAVEQAAKPGGAIDLGSVNQEDETWVNGKYAGASSFGNRTRYALEPGVSIFADTKPGAACRLNAVRALPINGRRTFQVAAVTQVRRRGETDSLPTVHG